MRSTVLAISLALAVCSLVWPAAAEFVTPLTFGSTGEKVVGHVRAVTFSPDGRKLAVAGDGGIRILSVDGGPNVPASIGEAKPAHSVAFSPDGRILASGGLDGSIKTWDLAS